MEQLQTAEARRFQHTVCRQQLSSACEKVLQVGERDGVQTMAEQGMDGGPNHIPKLVAVDLFLVHFGLLDLDLFRSIANDVYNRLE